MTSQRLRLKHATDEPEPDDGARVLIDRRWPEGVPREDAELTLWLQSAAPSRELLEWYADHPDRWNEFRRRYRGELEDRQEELDRLREMARGGRLTLVHAAPRGERSHATVLRELLRASTDVQA